MAVFAEPITLEEVEEWRALTSQTLIQLQKGKATPQQYRDAFFDLPMAAEGFFFSLLTEPEKASFDLDLEIYELLASEMLEGYVRIKAGGSFLDDYC